jgi:hypothetical protein
MPDPPRVVIATLKFHAARRDPGKHEILYMVFDDSRAAHLCLFVVSEPKPVAGPAARITASCSPEANRRDCTLRLVRETS